MGSERPLLSILIILCVLTGAQGFLFADISPDLLNVNFTVRVSYGGSVIDVIDSNLYGGGANTSVTSTNWTNAIVFFADYSGQNIVWIETRIDGIDWENSPQWTWDGTGYAGTFTTSNGYTIEVADQVYFDSDPVPDPDPDPVTTDATNEGILISFGIGVLLWQVFARSYRERSVTW